MTLRLLWTLSLAIIIGVGLGLLSFSLTWLDMERSIIPVFIYLGASGILFAVDRTSPVKNKIINSFIFILVSSISHFLPTLTFLGLYFLEK